MAESRIIETPRLFILPFRESFLTERYIGWLNDPEVVCYSEQRHKTCTIESCRAYWQSFNGTPNYFWAITAKDSKIGHIGNMNAYVDVANKVADVGILIGEKAIWGCGYGTEAWAAVCRYLLDEEGMHKVGAGTMAVNKGMLRIMAKAGMIDDGVRKRHFLFEGQEVDLIHKAFFKTSKEDAR